MIGIIFFVTSTATLLLSVSLLISMSPLSAQQQQNQTGIGTASEIENLTGFQVIKNALNLSM
jgi:hypothetical protein